MKQVFFLFFLLSLIYSCKQENQFPHLKTHKVSAEKLTLTSSDSIAELQEVEASAVNAQLPDFLNQLVQSVRYYNQKNENFNLQKFEEEWEQANSELDRSNAEEQVIEKWVEATGFLLQLTAEAKYAEELETIYLQSNNSEIQSLAATYAITKNVDHLHVNLFIPAKIKYDHSLDGKVEMVVETNYPETGRAELKFSMEKRRYIELQIRIPSWENEAHVTVKGVKYFAPAGGYCKIAKKWREGDLVEIIFPGIHNQNNM